MANLVPLSQSSLIKKQKSNIIKTGNFSGASKNINSNVINKDIKSTDNSLLDTYKKVIKIDSILKNLLKVKVTQSKKEKATRERTDFEKRERELEKKSQPKEKFKVNLPSSPRMGFLDWIKNFLLNTFLGFISVRLIDFLPQLTKILPTIIKVGEFIIDWGGKLLDGLVTFIDWGYKAYDGTRGFIKNLGGDGLVGVFDKFSGAVGGLIDVLIFASIASMGMGGDGGVKTRGGRPGKPTIKPQRGMFQKGARGAFMGLAGKQGAKAILKFVKPLVSRIPIIGGLIEFGLSWALGEPVGKAAFRGIGSVLVGAIGTLIGGPVGAFLGSWAGGEAGGLLYDMFFNNKKPKKKVAKAAGGGKPSTRGGKLVGGPAKRTIKKKKSTRTLTVPPTKIKPGSAIGGEKKIKQLYPESKDKTKMSPFDFLKNTYERFSKSKGLERIASLAIKPLLGDRLSYSDYKGAAATINNWMNQSMTPTTLAYAGGGEVRMEQVISGEDYSDVIARSLQESVTPEVDKTIQDLMKQLMLKPQEVQKGKSPGEDPNAMESGEDFGGDATDGIGGARLFMAAGFPMLAASILSGNIQQESGWKGQRTPWVLNDGAGTNKGLISWNRSRIVNAEKFLGKPLEKASNAEQVKWIKEELRQYGLLKIFLDPKSTEEQLKAASYKYIGWGDLGDRWKYSSRIFAALQKGEKGTYVPGGQNIGAGSGNWRFGLTGRTFMRAKGWSHAHFQSFDGSVDTLVRDTVPLAKRMASSGLKPELSDGTPILANKDNDYYVNLIRRGQSLHTHSGRKAAVDINMPGFPVVPFTLKDFQYDPGGGGNYATVPGSGKTVLMHMSKKPDGSAFHGKIGTALKDNFMLKLHKGEMYKVVDKDSVDLFGKDFIQDVIDIENKSQLIAKAPSIIEKLKAISGYTDYERPEPEIQIIEVPVLETIPVSSGSRSMNISGGKDIDNNVAGMEILDAVG